MEKYFIIGNGNGKFITLIDRKGGKVTLKHSKISSEAYTIFVEENKEMLYRIAYGYLQDHIKSLDVLDEAIYLGYSHLYQLKEPNYLKTWLVRILMNECHKILRKIIILRYFGGYTIEETAELLGIPEGTVSTRCRKGLSFLRVEISDSEE